MVISDLQRLPTTRETLEEWIGIRGTEPIANSVITPSGVIRPMTPFSVSVNQRFPSGAATMPDGLERDVGSSNSVKRPVDVNRATVLRPGTVTQMFPSGPAASSDGPTSG